MISNKKTNMRSDDVLFSPVKRRVSFNPIVQRGCHLSGYTNESLKTECKIKNTMTNEDILFVFMWILNSWAMTHDGDIAMLSVNHLRLNHLPTYKELEGCCNSLMAHLNTEKNVTLNGRAGRMLIKCTQSDQCDIDDVRTLQMYLKTL